MLGNLDLLLTMELQKLVGWHGGRIFLYGLGSLGGQPSGNVGDLQGVSNIEAPDDWKLFEAWFEQELLDRRLSLLAGLYDVNSEFDVVPSASLFLHGSQGLGADFGLSGRNGPSTFPITSLGVRIQARPVAEVYARFLVADGVPGDPDDLSGTRVRLRDDDGLLLAFELGYYDLPAPELRGRTARQKEDLPISQLRVGQFGKYALGAWGYTTRFDDFTRLDSLGAPRSRKGSWGVYAIAERRVLVEPDDPLQGLSVYARAGVADHRTTVVDGYLGGGLVYRGLLPNRKVDRTGISVSAAHLADGFREAARRGGRRPLSWEIAIELTHRLRLTRWLCVQPDLQYVVNPGGDRRLGDAVVAGLRIVVGPVTDRPLRASAAPTGRWWNGTVDV